MLKPLHNKEKSNRKFIKRLPLMLGDPICCPAVTFCQKNLNVKTLFANDMKCDIDWSAWEIASKMDGRFVFVNKPLMGHRIHEESTTTEIIEDNNRSKEDYEIFRRFWISPIAKLLTKLYSNSEKVIRFKLLRILKERVGIRMENKIVNKDTFWYTVGLTLNAFNSLFF